MAEDPTKRIPHTRWTKPRIVAGALALLAVLGYLGCTYRLAKPDGVYYAPFIGSVGDVYFVFKNGRLVLQTPQSGPEEFIGDYRLENGRWIMHGARGETQEMRFTATIVGIRLHDPQDQEPERFMFRRSFAWLPKARAWIDYHHSRK